MTLNDLIHACEPLNTVRVSEGEVIWWSGKRYVFLRHLFGRWLIQQRTPDDDELPDIECKTEEEAMATFLALVPPTVKARLVRLADEGPTSSGDPEVEESNRVAEAFRTRLGLSGWERMVDLGSGNFDPVPGHRHLFLARSGLGELERYGIYALTLVVTLPESVFVDIVLEGGGVALLVRPDRVSLRVDMEPFCGLIYRSLTESEIDEMRREWEPFRLVMEAVEAASAQLKAEAEAQKEDAE